MSDLRIGVLGAARIAPAALIKPARAIDGVRVVAVAARDRTRADAFATKHSIPFVHTGYEELIADPEIDAIYNPLPNGLHGRWTTAALDAGKHVLCEKPFTANRSEAETVAADAERTGLVVMEAFHYRYHPLAARMRQIVDSGELGRLRHVEAWNCFPLPKFSDIRYSLDLAGGALMDAGCYAVHMVRLVGAGEPDVVSATPTLQSPGIDRAMRADLLFAAGHSGRLTCSMWSRSVLRPIAWPCARRSVAASSTSPAARPTPTSSRPSVTRWRARTRTSRRRATRSPTWPSSIRSIAPRASSPARRRSDPPVLSEWPNA
jgi:predicted dehydrogenase